ncbi:MAG: hypothetical protein EHM46_03400 [Bacteroidetes bacterium]|nr:MAG: hypothetical protein EHM46_03400 [Bacteroidota bacterium]
MVLLLSAWAGHVFSQEWNYARLVLIYGGDIPFHFNSIKRYAEGIEIEEGTILGITLADSVQAGHYLTGFDLNMRAFNGATEILGEAGSLDLNVIRIRAANYLGFGPGFISDGYQDLSSGWTTLCTFTDPNPVFSDLVWDTHQLVISYECGKPVAAGGNGTLLGEPPDYYRVEVELELVPSGPGF